MDAESFDRIEKKYLVTQKEKKLFLREINKHMKKDSFFKSRVYNIYFDTDNLDLIIQSVDQPIFKEKIRARSYEGYDRVFIEIKTKLRGKDNNKGYKRRIMISKDEFKDFTKGKTTLENLVTRSSESKNKIQIAKEADYLIQRFNLKPQILVVYERESYQGENRLRITFDEKLKYRTKNLRFIQEKRDKIYFKDKRNIIMEVKAHGVLPLWLVKTMSSNKVFPYQFSKVGKIYEKIRKEEDV